MREIDALLEAAKNSHAIPRTLAGAAECHIAQQKFEELFYRTCYTLDRNPIHLWRLYKLARRTPGMRIPEEVLVYLDGVADGLIPTAPDGFLSIDASDDRQTLKRAVLNGATISKADETLRRVAAALLTQGKESDNELLQVADQFGIDLRTLKRWISEL